MLRGVAMLASLGMIFTQLLRSGGQHKQKLQGHRRDYVRYLAQLRDQARSALFAQQRSVRWVHFGPHPSALSGATRGTPREIA